MASRSWRWLRARILGLLERPYSFDVTGTAVFSTRLQAAVLTPPPDESQRAHR